MAPSLSHRSRKKRTSLLAELLAAVPHLHPQLYFKSSLVALSHAMEDQVLSGRGHPIVFANFQRERYYRQEARRYQRISALAQQVYVLATPETSLLDPSASYHIIALDPEDPLAQEWHLMIIDETYATCLVCRERLLKGSSRPSWLGREMDTARQFEGIWSFDRQVALTAARGLIPKILAYRPDLKSLLSQTEGMLVAEPATVKPTAGSGLDPAPFAERLITYLQAGQYKLQRAYRAIQLQEGKERLINRISTAIRISLDPTDILRTAIQELGQAAAVIRCLLYRCNRDQAQVQIEQEYCLANYPSLQGQPWILSGNPFLAAAMHQGESVHCNDTTLDTRLVKIPQIWQGAQIGAWLAVPVLYQGRLLGMLELHYAQPHLWETPILELAEAIALQVGVALIQAEAYQHLEDLNHQLEALDQAKSDLIAVTGHELRTPLSTIQICLETLSTDPDMPLELRQEMLDTALQDADRLRRLVQDFLTLSKLESGRIQWHIEAISAEECIELALSNITARRRREILPGITLEMPDRLLMVKADGEWLVEVLQKLLDNACKFTPATGDICLRLQSVDRRQASKQVSQMLNPFGGESTQFVQFTISDTGRGIDPLRLEQIFARFYQAEGSLRRSVGGTGLGLAISRFIIEGMGGVIWAESLGKDQGSTFHFLLPAVAAGATDRQDPLLSSRR